MRGLILAAALLLSTTVVLARPMPIPLGQWSPAAQLWMARAMVAEAGWLAERDHVGIAYVLSRRWASMRKRYPEIQFVHVIRGYCAGLEPGRAEFTPRQRWLHGLNLQLNEPDGWPRNVSWVRHRVWWQQVLQRAEAWSLGKLRDPCKGRAWHWGGEMDTPEGKMVEVDCGDTRNIFYGLQKSNGKEEAWRVQNDRGKRRRKVQ
jgi:hypothetical protein